MRPRRKLRAEEVLVHVLNDTDLELSTSSSESKSEASDEAGDLPHTDRNNVPRFILPLQDHKPWSHRDAF